MTKSEIFNSATANILYLMKMSHTYIEALVSFLSTIVSNSDDDDWEKFKRIITWVENTINSKCVIGEISFSDVFM